MKKIAAVLVAMVLAGCSGEPDSPSWVKGAQMDIEQDIRWDTDGTADCKRLEFSDSWFVMCRSSGKFGGLAYAVTEAANPRGFIAQPATGKAAQAAASFRASPVAGDIVRVDVDALREAFEAAYR